MDAGYRVVMNCARNMADNTHTADEVTSMEATFVQTRVCEALLDL